MPSAPTGTVVYFFNTSDMGKLYYITDSGTYYPASQGMSDLVAGYVAETWIKNASCAMASGMITVAEYNSIINSGILVTTASTDDGDGNRTSTLSVSSKTSIISVDITGDAIVDGITAGQTGQLVGSVLPSTAPQGLIWSSSDVSILTVTQTGLVTAVGTASQTATITAFSLVNPLIFKTVSILVN